MGLWNDPNWKAYGGMPRADGSWVMRYLGIEQDMLIEAHTEGDLEVKVICKKVIFTVGDIVRLKRLGPLGKIWGRLKNKEVRVNGFALSSIEFPPGFREDSQSRTLYWPGYDERAERGKPDSFTPVWVQVSDTWVPYYSLWRTDEKRRGGRKKGPEGSSRVRA